MLLLCLSQAHWLCRKVHEQSNVALSSQDFGTSYSIDMETQPASMACLGNLLALFKASKSLATRLDSMKISSIHVGLGYLDTEMDYHADLLLE